MEMDKSRTIRIESKRHNILCFYCKFKGKTIKKHIETLIDQDKDLQKFKRRVDDLCFKYEDEEE